MESSPWYITGFVDGEGCFSISFNLRKRLNTGIEVRPSFSISQNKRNLAVLKTIHNYFGCGSIRFCRKDWTYKYEVRSIRDLVEIIIPFFENYKLKTAKATDFEHFKNICFMVRKNLHRSKRHLNDLIEEAYKMNESGRRKYTKEFLLKLAAR